MRRPASCVLLLAALAGCGGSSDELPPAPEPDVSPPLAERPAGRVVPVGHKPEGIAADPGTGLSAVGLTNPDRLALVETRSGRVRRRLALAESPRHLALARPGGPVLVPAEKADRLVEVSLPDGRRRSVPVGEYPHDVTAAAGRTFVADEHADTVTVLEGARRVASLEAPVQPGGLAATSDGRYVGVVGVRGRALRVYDARTLRSVGEVNVGVGPTHVVAFTRRFFVVDTRGDALIEVRLEPEPVVHRRTHVPGAPYGIDFDGRRGRLWLTLTETNRVAELTDRRVLRTLPTVRQPNSVAVDEASGRVLVTGRVDGVLQLIGPGR